MLFGHRKGMAISKITLADLHYAPLHEAPTVRWLTQALLLLETGDPISVA
jgi:hypothetical protein